MKTVIEHEHPEISQRVVNDISRFVVSNGLQSAKLYVSIYYPALFIGMGSSHIWIKAKDDRDTRLAITYLS